jgi:hypothetical protein
LNDDVPGRSPELIPLLQVRDAPQPASYFYNRCEKSEMRLVSYQIAELSEVASTSPAVMELLKDIKIGGKSNN